MMRCSLAVFIVCLMPALSPAAPDRPNVLIVTVDDMNADSIGAYGCPLPDISPNMDRLVKSGLRFEYAHVQVGNCMPGRNVMWSGCYPHNNAVEGFYQVKQPPQPHLVDVMKSAGYFTAISGKTSHSTPFNPYAWDEVFDTDPDGKPYNKKNPAAYGAATSRAIAAAKKTGKPFCVMINVADPHKPFYTGLNDPFQPSHVYQAADVPIPDFLFDDPAVRAELAAYYCSVSRSDDCVGRIMDSLKTSGMEEETVVIFLSDHGMPLPFAKTQLYHHSTHTPLAIRWPGVTQPNTLDKQHMVSAVDLLPTIMEITGAAKHPTMDGRSFTDIVKGETQADREFVVKEYNENAGRSRDPMRAVQTKQFLYIFNPWSNGTRVFATATTGTSSYRRLAALAKTDASLAKRLEIYQHRVVEEMYDVVEDPACLHNLIDEKKYEAVIEQQRQRLLAWMEKTNDHMLPMYRNRTDAAAREAYVVAMEAASAARGSKNKKPKPQGSKPIKKDVFSVVFPKHVTAATTVEYSLKHDVPKAYGKVGLTITLKQGNKGARVDRREITVEGKGVLVVKFEIPSNPTDGKVSFAIWAGEDFENKLQYLHSEPVPVKYLDD